MVSSLRCIWPADSWQVPSHIARRSCSWEVMLLEATLSAGFGTLGWREQKEKSDRGTSQAQWPWDLTGDPCTWWLPQQNWSTQRYLSSGSGGWGVAVQRC